MKILIDTNIIIDFLLKREPFFDNAVFIIDLIENKKVKGYISSISVTTVDYIVSKSKSKEFSYKFIKDLLDIFEICKVDKNSFILALKEKGKDFEDNVLIANAIEYDIDYIITRNKKDFLHSNIKVLTPSEFIDLVE